MPKGEFTLEEYERRIRDILNKYRVPQDKEADFREIAKELEIPQQQEVIE